MDQGKRKELKKRRNITQEECIKIWLQYLEQKKGSSLTEEEKASNIHNHCK
jgi:hypothetical protein